MQTGRFTGTGGLRRGAAALVSAALVSAALAGGGPAAAAAHSDDVAVPRTGTAAGVISTAAGGVGGPARATSVALDNPCGVLFTGGRLYVASGGTVREVDPAAGGLRTPVGTGATGPLGDGGKATRASVGTCGVTADHAGNLLIADASHQRVRAVAKSTGTFYGQPMTAGHIYTIAGDGRLGFSGDGGPAAEAKLNGPAGVAVDAAGNILIADIGNQRIRVVAASSGTFYGRPMTAGHIYSIAGNGTEGFAGDGGPATKAELNQPTGVAVDDAGNVLIGDSFNQRIRVVAETTGTFYGQPMTAGDIYTVAGDGTEGFAGDGGPATSAELAEPGAVAVDHTGNLLIPDFANQRIRVVAETTGTFYGQPMTAGHIYTVAGDGTEGFAGDGSPATSAELFFPRGAGVDAAGNLLIADSDNNRVRMVAETTGTFYGQPMTAGHIYTIAGNGNAAFSGDGGPATSAEFSGTAGVAVDHGGNLLIADAGDNRVRVTAGSTGTFYGRPMTAGHVYTVAGDGTPGFSGDGGPATSAEFSRLAGVAVDHGGNLLIADAGNDRVRMVAETTGTFYGQPMTAGHIYTVAGDGVEGRCGSGGPATGAKVFNPQGVAADAAGNLLIADTFGDCVQVVAASSGTFYGRAMTAGDIYTIAGTRAVGFSGDGGPATKAKLDSPAGVAMDATGNVLISDSDNDRVRVVAERAGTFYGKAMTAGDIYTIAGDGTVGLSGDRGPATKAGLFRPAGLAMDATGNVLISDTLNNRVRVVAERTGTFYGQPMTAGDIYTVASAGPHGTGAGGFSGDGGPATKAELNGPAGVAVHAGNLLIADRGNSRIRMVAG